MSPLHSGITPAPASAPMIDLNPEPRKQEVQKAAPCLLSDLVDIVSDFETEPALKPLKINRAGNVIVSAENLTIRLAIKEAFVSRIVDPRVKRIMLENAINGNYLHEINRIFGEIRRQGHIVCLDHSDLSKLTLSDLELINVSADYVDFTDSTLQRVSFQGGTMTSSNLTRTSFIDSDLKYTPIYFSTMMNTNFYHTQIAGVSVHENQCDIHDVITEKLELNADGDLDENYYLNGCHSFDPAVEHVYYSEPWLNPV
jgi:hypothetical protein